MCVCVCVCVCVCAYVGVAPSVLLYYFTPYQMFITLLWISGSLIQNKVTNVLVQSILLHTHRTYFLINGSALLRSSMATLQHIATHCNTLQHTATHYNTLQHSASYLILDEKVIALAKQYWEMKRACVCVNLWMFVGMYAYVYIYVYTYIYIHIHISIHIYTYLCTYIYTYIYVYTYRYIYIY